MEMRGRRKVGGKAGDKDVGTTIFFSLDKPLLLLCFILVQWNLSSTARRAFWASSKCGAPQKSNATLPAFGLLVFGSIAKRSSARVHITRSRLAVAHPFILSHF
jgi:hypothetical protein